MHCLKCGCKWRIGNMSPNISFCPICDTDFTQNVEYRGYDSIAELLMCLLLEKGDDICLNNLQITSYLNDFFPQEALLRDQIEKLLNHGIGEYVYQCRNINKPRNNLRIIVWQAGLLNSYDDIEKTVFYLTGRINEEGSNIEKANFYLDQVEQLHNDSYKLAALEKANKLSPDIYALNRQADLLLKVGNTHGAIEVLEKASETGNEAVILRLANIYERGEITQQNYGRAADLYSQLERQDSTEGLYHLGKLFYLGRGVEKNISQAVEYFSRSAEKGNYRAQYFLYRILYKDNPIAAVDCLVKSAAQNFEPAMYDLAIHLLYGDDIIKDVTRAIGLLEECSKNGNRDAASKLYYMYMTGYEVAPNKEKALHYKMLLGEG